MAARGSNGKYAILAVAVVCFLAILPVQMKIDSLRSDLQSRNILPTQLPEAAAVSAAIGGFRGIAVDILWMQADALQNNRQFYQLMTYYDLISLLQPNFPSVWSFNTWNMAYNISAEWGRPEEKWLWIKKGFDFGEEGLKSNSDSVELYVDMGAMYMHKIGRDEFFTKKLIESRGLDAYQIAARLFEKAIEVSRERGDVDVRLYTLHAQAVFRHGIAILGIGNVPEAMKCFDQAAEEVANAQMEYPDDLALEKLRTDIRDKRNSLVDHAS